jgi:hypothetical protein
MESLQKSREIRQTRQEILQGTNQTLGTSNKQEYQRMASNMARIHQPMGAKKRRLTQKRLYSTKRKNYPAEHGKSTKIKRNTTNKTRDTSRYKSNTGNKQQTRISKNG